MPDDVPDDVPDSVPGGVPGDRFDHRSDDRFGAPAGAADGPPHRDRGRGPGRRNDLPGQRNDLDALVAATASPRTRASLARELSALGVRSGDTLLIHASLSSLGWVCGGAVAVVEALLDAAGGTGTLVVPAFCPGNSDPSGWTRPAVPRRWWPAIRESLPAYDPHVTPGEGTGAIAEAVRTWPGALRSDHPVYSFSALGPGAGHVVERHAPDCAFGPRSPMAALEAAGARVLMLGTGWEACAAFTPAWYAPGAPRRTLSFATGTPRGRTWLTVEDAAPPPGGPGAPGPGFEASGAVTRGVVGSAGCRLFALADAVAYARTAAAR